MIGIPSPQAIRDDKFPGVRIGSDPLIGENSIIFGNVFIGNNFRCGNDVLIREETSIGDDVTVGNNCYIDTGVSVAGRTNIEHDVRVPRQTTIGERVFIGTGVSFLSEASFDRGSRSIRGAILEDGCTVSAHAILYPRVCIGCGASIAAGTVVTRNVPPNVCASGNPMRFRKLRD